MENDDPQINNYPLAPTSTATDSVGGRSYYLVRSSRSIPLEENVVGVGWDDIHFCDYIDGDLLVSTMTQLGWNIGRNANQIRRFKAIKRGDIIVVPYWGSAVIGVATGEERHNPSCASYHGANQQRVRFLLGADGQPMRIPRSSLREALQRRLKIRITIADLREFAADLDGIVINHEAGRDTSQRALVETRYGELLESLRASLLSNIQCGNTGLVGGGVGLEKLVTELLEIDGFEVDSLGKRTFGPSIADADVHAEKTDALRTDEFLIQVKHHRGRSDDRGLRQLLAIKYNYPEYADCQLVLVTSGSLSLDDNVFAEKNDITVKDGSALVDWIIDAFPRLRRETQLALGMINLPQLFKPTDQSPETIRQ